MKPTIGRIIHVCIGVENDAPILRPALVVRVWSDDCVNAILFADGSNDDRHLLPIYPSVGTHQERGGAQPWLTSILRGDGVCQWRWPEIAR